MKLPMDEIYYLSLGLGLFFLASMTVSLFSIAQSLRIIADKLP